MPRAGEICCPGFSVLQGDELLLWSRFRYFLRSACAVSGLRTRGAPPHRPGRLCNCLSGNNAFPHFLFCRLHPSTHMQIRCRLLHFIRMCRESLILFSELCMKRFRLFSFADSSSGGFSVFCCRSSFSSGQPTYIGPTTRLTMLLAILLFSSTNFQWLRVQLPSRERAHATKRVCSCPCRERVWTRFWERQRSVVVCLRVCVSGFMCCSSSNLSGRAMLLCLRFPMRLSCFYLLTPPRLLSFYVNLHSHFRSGFRGMLFGRS